MKWTLETILTKFAIGTSPLVRQASCVWLLTVLKLAGKHPDIQVSLVEYVTPIMSHVVKLSKLVVIVSGYLL